MTLITRTVSALVLTAAVLSPALAQAATPFDIANRAQRGQLEGIPSYQALEQDLVSGRVTPADILRAAGETPTPQAERSVSNFLSILSNDD